jgi:hypothetical protein
MRNLNRRNESKNERQNRRDGENMTKLTRAEIVTTARLLVSNLALQLEKLGDGSASIEQSKAVKAALKLTIPVLEGLQRELRRKPR